MPCPDGIEARRLAPPDPSFGFGDLAGDFTVTTTDGSFSLSERWTGCDSYTFVGYVPLRGDAPTQTDRLWTSPVETLLGTPSGAHFFFLSWEPTEADRRARVESMQGRIEAAIASLPAEEQAGQRARFHFVIDAPTGIEGSVGQFLRDYRAYMDDPAGRVDLGDRGVAPPPFPFAFAIDRHQRWDPVGNLSEIVGGNFALRMVSYLPDFFDHKARIAHRVQTEQEVWTAELLDAEVTARVHQLEATLPTGAEMARFDTLELDLTDVCRERNVFACSEWDRIARFDLCLDEACTERRELIRWITSYWRRGEQRWIMDASPLLGLLSDGGHRRFRLELGPEWERPTPRVIRAVLRLSRTGGLRSAGAVRVFTGGRFEQSGEANYNNREPVAFTPPATAQRVELVLLLSGHGQVQPSNCAEWCDHRHRFTVNGTALPEVRHEGRVGSIGGCGPASARGVVPGQWGNWAPERAFWCPGLPVEPIRLDITELVRLGEENQVGYSATVPGTIVLPGGDIALSAYVAWFE